MRILQLHVVPILLMYAMTGSADEVSCDVEYAGKVTSVIIKPVSDPYEMTNVDPGGDFRFASNYLVDSNKLKTYVYHKSKNRYVLIHAAEHQVSEDICTQHENGFGLNRVYSAKLERELLFQCRLICR